MFQFNTPVDCQFFFKVTLNRSILGMQHLVNLPKLKVTVAVQKGKGTWDGLDQDKCKVSEKLPPCFLEHVTNSVKYYGNLNKI